MFSNLKILSDTIIEVLNENSKDNLEYQFFFSQLEEFEYKLHYFNRRRFTDPIIYEALRNYVIVTLFCEVFNLNWFTLI